MFLFWFSYPLALARLKSFLVITTFYYAEELASAIFQMEGPIHFLTLFLGSNPPFNIPTDNKKILGFAIPVALKTKKLGWKFGFF